MLSGPNASRKLSLTRSSDQIVSDQPTEKICGRRSRVGVDLLVLLVRELLPGLFRLKQLIMKLLIINTVIKTAFINSPILSRGVLPGPFGRGGDGGGREAAHEHDVLGF